MVGKIVVDGHAVDGAAHFHSTPHALEAPECLDGRLCRDARVPRGGDGGDGVLDIVTSDRRPVDDTLQAAAVMNLETRSVASRGKNRVPSDVATAVQRKSFDRCPAAFCQGLVEVNIVALADDAAVARHHAQQLMELPLNGRYVGIDIGVIVFEIVQNHGPRSVMHELGTLIEEGGVVFVGFDDEVHAGAHSRGSFEITRYAADQEPRVATGRLENPHQHAGRGRLTVGSRDGQYPTLLQYVPRQPFGTRGVWNAALEQGFDQRISPAHDISDDHHIGIQFQLLRVVALDDLDAQ